MSSPNEEIIAALKDAWPTMSEDQHRQVQSIVDDLSLDLLLKSADYIKLAEFKPEFDLFALFKDVLVENSWSRILAFLLDSRRNHNLGIAMFREWIQSASSQLNQNQLSAFIELLNREGISTRSHTEWGTDERRRIDVVTEIFEGNKRCVAVLGIENKLWSAEQCDQVGDYQKALDKAYPAIPKILIFLTPDGRQSITCATLDQCPSVNLSYSTVVMAGDKILPTTSGQINLLISSMCHHLRRCSMNDQAKELVRKLYANPAHRMALKLIASNIPSVKETMVKLPTAMKAMNKHVEFAWDWRGHEFNFSAYDINKIVRNKNMAIYYMLLSESQPEPADIGDAVTVRLMLHYENDTDKRNEIAKVLRAELPDSKGRSRQWAPWANIWVGESYVLQDFGENDLKGLCDILSSAINGTYPILRKCVETNNL